MQGLRVLILGTVEDPCVPLQLALCIHGFAWIQLTSASWIQITTDHVVL